MNETNNLKIKFVQWSLENVRPDALSTTIIFMMDQKEHTLIEILGQMSLFFHEDSKNTTLQLESSPIWKLQDI